MYLYRLDIALTPSHFTDIGIFKISYIHRPKWGYCLEVRAYIDGIFTYTNYITKIQLSYRFIGQDLSRIISP